MVARPSYGLLAALALTTTLAGQQPRAARRVDPPGRAARRSLLPGRRRDARPPHRHHREPGHRRLHPRPLRADRAEAGRPGRLVFPDLQPDDRHAGRRQRPAGARRRRRGATARARPGLLPAALQRQRGSDRAGGLCRVRHHRAALAVRRLQRRRRREDRAGARPRAGRARREEPVRRRGDGRAGGALAQGARRAGEGRGRHPVRRRRPQPSRAAQLRAGRPRRVARRAAAPEDLHAVGLGGSPAHSGGADLTGAGRVAGRRHRPELRGAGGIGRDRARPRRPGPARARGSRCGRR